MEEMNKMDVQSELEQAETAAEETTVKEAVPAEPVESMEDFSKELEASYDRYFQRDLPVTDDDEETAALWEHFREQLENKESFSVKITGVTKGGAIAMVDEVRAFIPASKLSLDYISEDDLPAWLNKHITVRIITADEETKRLVLSAKDILREEAEAERAKKVSAIEIGQICEGTVETLKPYGAFIDLGNGISGLLHISQISNQRIKHPGVVLEEGQTVKVKIIDNKDGKISLSMKVLEEAAPEEQEETVEIPETEEIGTSLGSLFANLKL